jgi:hypothetical protein
MAPDRWRRRCTSGAAFFDPFNVLNNNFGVTQFYGAAATPRQEDPGGTQDNGTLCSTRLRPAAWVDVRVWRYGGFSAVDPTDPNFLYGSMCS